MMGFLSKLSNSEKKILFIAVLFIVGALFDRFFLSPLIERIELIDVEIEQQQVNMETDKKILTHKNRINKESQELAKYYVKDIPEDGVINGEILSLVERLSDQMKVKLVKSTPTEIEKNDDFNKYFVDLECLGELKDIVSFIHAVNSTDQMLKVDQLKMNPTRGEDNQVKATLKVSKLLLSSKTSN